MLKDANAEKLANAAATGPLLQPTFMDTDPAPLDYLLSVTGDNGTFGLEIVLRSKPVEKQVTWNCSTRFKSARSISGVSI